MVNKNGFFWNSPTWAKRQGAINVGTVSEKSHPCSEALALHAGPGAPSRAAGAAAAFAEADAATRAVARGSALSWKIRYRTLLWFFSQMIKLYRARSLLYRRQILQGNIRWKALDEIYKICMLLHRSDLNIQHKCVKIFRIFRQKFVRKYSL